MIFKKLTYASTSVYKSIYLSTKVMYNIIDRILAGSLSKVQEPSKHQLKQKYILYIDI